MKLRLLLHICLIFISVTVFGQSLAPFVPTGIMDNDAYGFSVSIDEQGELAVVGSPMDSEISASAGAAYVLVKQGNNWSEQIKLTAPDAAANDWFGHGVTMSSSGNFIAVSALLDDDNGSESGSVYIFVKDGGTWTFQAKITPTDGSTMDWFGQSLSLNQQGDVLAVSSHLDDDNGNDSGSAYIFERIGDTWSERDKITPTDGDAEDYFAYALSLDASGNRL
ncbi:MAG: hypothetical protein ACPG5P_06320, partial [Saprospiraceae bacterium]